MKIHQLMSPVPTQRGKRVHGCTTHRGLLAERKHAVVFLSIKQVGLQGCLVLCGNRRRSVLAGKNRLCFTEEGIPRGKARSVRTFVGTAVGRSRCTPFGRSLRVLGVAVLLAESVVRLVHLHGSPVGDEAVMRTSLLQEGNTVEVSERARDPPGRLGVS